MLKFDKRTVQIRRRPLAVILVIALVLTLLIACNAGDPLAALDGADVTETAEPATSPPLQPSSLAISLSGPNQLTLTWMDNSDNEEGFIIRRELVSSDQAPAELGRPPADAISFLDGSIQCASDYQYYLSAFNALGITPEICLKVTVPQACNDPSQAVSTGPCGESDDATATPVPTATTDTSGGTTPVATAVPPTVGPSCGDGTCNGSETAGNCPTDCPAVCGDSFCSSSETTASCAADCPASCGDSTCSGGESAATCPADCPSTCGDSYCTGGETAASCDSDCPASCGDGACTHAETPFSCLADCPTICGDGLCAGSETAITCIADCPLILSLAPVTLVPLIWCGDGVCNGTENSLTCIADCPLVILTLEPITLVPLTWCGDGTCNGTENIFTCPADC